MSTSSRKRPVEGEPLANSVSGREYVEFGASLGVEQEQNSVEVAPALPGEVSGESVDVGLALVTAAAQDLGGEELDRLARRRADPSERRRRVDRLLAQTQRPGVVLTRVRDEALGFDEDRR
ncbi:hypothetical protein [Pseudonocardia halophobica]|uniref:hypothetical protein n=1 Tax=Pseudonocardia halophobica TaxID=29401 RepID=UPI0012DD99B6|nr:hypothetical protein [Pseudonocardia halophobica]